MNRGLTGLSLLIALTPACSTSSGYDPGVTAADFRAQVDNRWLPFPPGARWVYSSTTAAGHERIEVEVLAERKTVAFGVETTVVHDTSYLNGEKTEETWDWYAQHRDGSVWYMGEDTAEYEHGQVSSREGAWEAGVEGALPGVAMPAAPAVGQRYRQEFLEGEAEDFGEVMAVGAAVDSPLGRFEGCVQTLDTSAIDPGLHELKYYCPGVGLVRVEESSGLVELTARSGT